MKTMKKTGWIAIALVAVAILTTVGLVIGCRPVVDSGLRVPEGYASVRVNFNNNIARTVLADDDPGTGVASITDFEVVALQFSGTDTLTVWVPAAASSPAITVKAGSYAIVATAYLTGTIAAGAVLNAAPGNLAAPAAWGALPSASYTATTNTTDPLTLRASADKANADPDKTGNGSFSYKINNTTTTTAGGSIAVVTYGGTNAGAGSIPSITLAAQTPPPVQAGWSGGPTTLGVGFYLINVEFTRVDATINHQYVLHIYEGMNSLFEFTLTDDYFAIENVTITVLMEYIPPKDAGTAPTVGVAGATAYVGTGLPTDSSWTVALPAAAPAVTVTFTANATDFDSFEWKVNGVALAPPNTTGSLTRNIGPGGQITAKGTYQITAIGTIDQPDDEDDNSYWGPFSTVVWLKVE